MQCFPETHRDRLLTSDVAQRFFAEVNKQAKRLMSDEHFTIDGTLIQAWASQKSFRSKDGSDDGDGTNFHGQKRSNKDAWSRPHRCRCAAVQEELRQGVEAELSGSCALVEDRNGLIAAAMVTHHQRLCQGAMPRCWSLQQKQENRPPPSRWAPTRLTTRKDFVSKVQELNVTPRVTKNNKGRRSNLDRMNHAPARLYRHGLSRRWLIEKGLCWLAADKPAPCARSSCEALGESGLAVRLQLRRAQRSGCRD